MASDMVFGIIGGSGLYDLEGLTDTRWETVQSPFGEPSDAFLFGKLDGQDIVFVPRHGRGHRLPPGAINYRANIDAMKRCGVTHVLSIGAVGSLQEMLPPGTFVIVDQFVDRTFAREKSFFGTGLVAHVSMAKPTCERLSDIVGEAAKALGLPAMVGGTYLAMEGPQFSTLAESEIYRSWGCDVIGMTGMPEAKLAREAEMHYATVAMVTDYDCWHPNHEAVSVESVIAVLLANAEHGRQLVRKVVPMIVAGMKDDDHQGCSTALDAALITAPDARDPELLSRLDAVAGRVLAKTGAS